MKGEITSYFDVAQVTLYVFWIFFAGLIFYLRREDRREGYPLFSEPSNTYKDQGFLYVPPPKVFLRPDGSTYQAPTGKPDDRTLRAEKIAVWPGAPLVPVGDPMLAAVGPGSYAERRDVPDITFDGRPRIVPMRTDSHFSVSDRDPDPRGMSVVGADRRKAGTIVDVWIDRAEVVIRYLEAEIPMPGGATRRVLVPMNFAKVSKSTGEVKVQALLAEHFVNVPGTANPELVTLLEEDKITGYFGGGTLYATRARAEPLL